MKYTWQKVDADTSLGHHRGTSVMVNKSTEALHGGKDHSIISGTSHSLKWAAAYNMPAEVQISVLHIPKLCDETFSNMLSSYAHCLLYKITQLGRHLPLQSRHHENPPFYYFSFYILSVFLVSFLCYQCLTFSVAHRCGARQNAALWFVDKHPQLLTTDCWEENWLVQC